jgi:hypothetical protein
MIDKAPAKAFDNIEIFVRSVIPTAKTQWIDSENLQIVNGGAKAVVPIGRDQLDDFETVLEGHLPRAYSSGIKNGIQFRIYIALGIAGMIPGVRISTLILQDERDWLRQCRLLNTHYSGEQAKNMYVGLKALENSLAQTLNLDVELPDVQEELGVVRALTSFYEEHKHLRSPEVTLESLTYLKAAMVYWIMALENKKADEVVERVKAAYDVKIYGIVQQLQADPYNRIKLPTAIYDYVARLQQGSKTRVAKPQRDLSQADEIDALLRKLNPRFAERRIGAWEALASENPDRLSQAANSMVELLDQVIRQLCNGAEFKEYLSKKFNSSATTKWVTTLRASIAETKSHLHTVKHHPDPQSEKLTEELMRHTESILRIILD